MNTNMQPDTSLVKVPAIELVSDSTGAITGLVFMLALLFICWYATRKGDAP